MNVKYKALNAALLTAFAGLSTTALAVQPGDDGVGQVLIYPYYTVNNGNDTLLSVVNTSFCVKVVKVRFIEGKNSREVLDFNLFLSPNDVWTAVITKDAATGGAVIKTSDTSCTAPAIPAAGQAFRNTLFTDGGGSGLDRTTEGYFEMIEMGVVPYYLLIPATGGGQIPMEVAATHVQGVPVDCAAIRRRYATTVDSLLSPSGGMFGTGTIVSVAGGASSGYDAIALDAFSDIQLHTGPGSLSPSLASAEPKVSQIFAYGDVVMTFWDSTNAPGSTGADPVSAVLMRGGLMNEFVTDPGLNAGTDWVITMPTKRFYVPTVSNNNNNNFRRPFSTEFKPGNLGACERVDLYPYDREEKFVEGDIDFSPLPEAGFTCLPWEVNVVTFNNTNVLGSGLKTNVNSPVGPNGWMFMDLTVAEPLANPAGNGTTDDLNGWPSREMRGAGWSIYCPSCSPSFTGHTFFGLPVVGFAVNRYQNGDVGGLLSNYANTYAHKSFRSFFD